MNAQRFLAVMLTALFFLLVIFGGGLLFKVFGHQGWGYLVGIGFCVLMVVGFVRENRRDSGRGK